MITINYSSFGLPMTDQDCKAFPERVKERIGDDFVFFIANELALYSVCLAIVKGEIDHTKVNIEFNGNSISIDKDGLLTEWPDGLMDHQEKVCYDLIMTRVSKGKTK